MIRILSSIVLAAFGLGLSAGCGNRMSLNPVEGKAYLDEKPLASGLITLVPDASKGNTTSFRPSGSVRADGGFTIESEHGKGAPKGAYKVLVHQGLPTGAGAPITPIPAKYQDEAKSDLRIEVAESPSPTAYDLKLKAGK